MPDLATRRQHEAEIAAILLLLFEDEARRYASASVFYPDRLAARVRDALAAPLARVHLEAAKQVADKEKWQVPPVLLAEQSAAWGLQHAKDVASEIAAGTAERLAVEDPNLDAVFGQSRAESIAITEVTTAISGGEAWVWLWASVEVFGDKGDAAGISGELMLAWLDTDRVTRIWQTERDSKVCSICRPLDRQPDRVWRAEFPAGPPAHPRCRCWLEYEVKRRGLMQPGGD